MRLFICEFITGGGMQDADLPPALAREGDIMLQALLADLLEAGEVELVCTRDPRLEPLPAGIEVIAPGKAVRATWRSCMAAADAVWIIAPETGGILHELTLMAEQTDCLLLGCNASSVKISSSKAMTIRQLSAANIPVVPVIEDINCLRESVAGWVIKPDDGAGAESCHYFTEQAALMQHIRSLETDNFVLQEFVPGVPASISMLCYRGKACVIGCNRQLFGFEQGHGHLSGIVVNGLSEFFETFQAIAAGIAAAIDGLAGYAGIDLILTEEGPRVVEINPRLTTAYAGLHQSLGTNPARLILSMLMSGRMPDRHGLNCLPVTLRL